MRVTYARPNILVQCGIEALIGVFKTSNTCGLADVVVVNSLNLRNQARIKKDPLGPNTKEEIQESLVNTKNL